MFRKNYTAILLAGFIVLHLFSCVPQQKAVSHRQKLSALDSQLTEQNKKLNELEAKRKTKEDHNEIDDTASARIKTYIGVTTAEIDKLITQNTILIADAAVNREDWNRLKKALAWSQGTSKKISDKVDFLNDLINRNMVVKLDQDVLFESGKYTVETQIADAIGRFFEPAAREIDLFTQKYPDFPLSLVITAKGYADGTSIVEGTPLYKDLAEGIKLSGIPPDNKELNKELSRRRADEVIKLFKKYTYGRSTMGGSVRNILFLTEGKGEQLPNPGIRDYSIDDARRRVVLLFWSVFPE